MTALTRLWRLRGRRPVFVAVSLFTLGFFAVYPAIDWILRGLDIAPEFVFWDVGAYLEAVERWGDGGTIYVPHEDGGYHGAYLYPPLSILLFLPFSLIPDFHLAGVTIELTSLGVLWLGLQALLARLDVGLAPRERLGLLWVLFGFHPLLFSLKQGQIAGFMGGLLCLAGAWLYSGERGDRPRALLSGGLTAVVGFVKLAYAPIGAHLLASRDRFVGGVVVGFVLLICSLLVFGVEVHRTYLEVLAWGVGEGGGGRSPTLWLPGYYRPLQWVPAPQLVRLVASAAIVAAAVLVEGRDRTVFALGVAAFPLLTPLPYTYYLVALLPAAVILLADELDGDGYPIVPVLGLLFAGCHAYGLKLVVHGLPGVVPGWTALEPAYLLLQPGLWGNLLIVGLAVVRVADGLSVSTDALATRRSA